MLNTIGVDEGFQDGDFGAYHRAARVVARGESPYQVDEYGPEETFVYSPAFAYSIRPLGSLDYPWAARVWILMNFALWAVCIHLALELALVDSRRHPMHWGMVWLGGVATLSYFWNNVRVGQAGTLMVFFCLLWVLCLRRGRSFLSGLPLAAAIAVKLAPVVLVPYLILRRDWRAVAGLLVGGLILLAIPALWVGWEGAIRLHLEWIPHCQETQTFLQTCRRENQSILGALARLPAISNATTCYSLSRLDTLKRVYPALVLVLAGAIYGWIFWTLPRDRGRLTRKVESSRENLHVSLLFIFMTLAHPRGWSFNYVALILPCMLLTVEVFRRSLDWKKALWTLTLLTVVCALPKCVNVVGDWSWPRWVYQSKDIWAVLLVAGVCIRSYARKRNAQQLTLHREPAWSARVDEKHPLQAA